MPRLRRHAPVRCGAEHRRLRGISLDEACKMTLAELCTMGGRRARIPAGGDAAHGAKHLRIVSDGGKAPDGAGPRLSRRWTAPPPPSPQASASACSLPARCATAPPACCMCWTSPPSGCIPPTLAGLTGVMQRPGGGRQFRAAGGPRHADPLQSRLAHRNGPAGRRGRRARGGAGHTAEALAADARLRSSALFSPAAAPAARPRANADGQLFRAGRIHLSTSAIHTVKPLAVDIPKGRLTVVTGVSGSGKTTLDSGKPDPGAGGGTLPARSCPAMSAPIRSGRHRARQADRRHAHRHQRALHRGHLRQRPRRAAQDLCQNAGRQAASALRRAISPTTPASCAARSATARASSAWTCSFCRTWTFPARTCRGSRYAKDAGACEVSEPSRAMRIPCPN